MSKTHRQVEDESMKQKNVMTDEEWQGIKAKGKPTDEEYSKRYEALLDRYGIKKAGGGAMEIQANEDPKEKPADTSERTHRTVKHESMKDVDTSSDRTAIVKNSNAVDRVKDKITPQGARSAYKERDSASKAPPSKKTPSTTPVKASSSNKTTTNPSKQTSKLTAMPAKGTGTKETSKPSSAPQKPSSLSIKGYEPENQDVLNINGKHIQTKMYNNTVEQSVRRKRYKQGKGLTVSQLRREYQQERLKTSK